jgi:hypothetical protein
MRTHLPARFDEGAAVILTTALTHARHPLTGRPVAALSAPCTTRRLLRPATTTTACSPHRAQAARNRGNSRSGVASPNQTSPPAVTIAAACAATAFVLAVRRIGTPQDELGPLPSPA